jgi:hypothetical protein
MQFECKTVFQEEIEDIFFELHRIRGKSADKLHRKTMHFRQFIASHGLLVIALRSLQVIELLRPVQAGADGDIVLCQDIG